MDEISQDINLIAGDNISIEELGSNIYKIHSTSHTGLLSKVEYDKNKSGSVDNTDKVNNHVVLVDVPNDAKFTDTTYTIKDGELSEINFTKQTAMTLCTLLEKSTSLTEKVNEFQEKQRLLKNNLDKSLDKYLTKSIKEYTERLDSFKQSATNLYKLIESHSNELDEHSDKLIMITDSLNLGQKELKQLKTDIEKTESGYGNAITELDNKISKLKTLISNKLDDFKKSDAFNKPFGKAAKTIAEGNHTHELNLPNFDELYAVKQHQHSGLESKGHKHEEYATKTHTHENHANAVHSHDDRYVTREEYQLLLEKIK